jgi:hypothetical protein
MWSATISDSADRRPAISAGASSPGPPFQPGGFALGAASGSFPTRTGEMRPPQGAKSVVRLREGDENKSGRRGRQGIAHAVAKVTGSNYCDTMYTLSLRSSDAPRRRDRQ